MTLVWQQAYDQCLKYNESEVVWNPCNTTDHAQDQIINIMTGGQDCRVKQDRMFWFSPDSPKP